MRYADARKAGNSEIVPFRKGEPPTQRHARRLSEAIKAKGLLEAALVDINVSLAVHNEAQHWLFSGAVRAEWWPATAKLVIDRKYSRGIHCHDWTQVVRELKKNLAFPG